MNLEKGNNYLTMSEYSSLLNYVPSLDVEEEDEDVCLIGSELFKYEEQLMTNREGQIVNSDGFLEEGVEGNSTGKAIKEMLKGLKGWLYSIGKNVLQSGRGSVIESIALSQHLSSFEALSLHYCTSARELINLIKDPSLLTFSVKHIERLEEMKKDDEIRALKYTQDRAESIYAVFQDSVLTKYWSVVQIIGYSCVLTKECLDSWMSTEVCIKEIISDLFTTFKVVWEAITKLEEVVVIDGFIYMDPLCKSVILAIKEYFLRTGETVNHYTAALIKKFAHNSDSDLILEKMKQFGSFDRELKNILDSDHIWTSTVNILKTMALNSCESFSELVYRLVLSSRESTLNVQARKNQNGLLGEIRSAVKNINIYVENQLKTLNSDIVENNSSEDNVAKEDVRVVTGLEIDVKLRFTKEYLLYKQTMALRQHLHDFDSILENLEKESSSLFSLLSENSVELERTEFLNGWKDIDKVYCQFQLQLDRHKSCVHAMRTFYNAARVSDESGCEPTEISVMISESTGKSCEPPLPNTQAKEILFEENAVYSDNEEEFEIEDEIFEAVGGVEVDSLVENVEANSKDKTGYQVLIEELKFQLVDRQEAMKVREEKAQLKRKEHCTDSEVRESELGGQKSTIDEISKELFNQEHNVVNGGDKITQLDDENEIISERISLASMSMQVPFFRQELTSALHNRLGLCLEEETIGSDSDSCASD